MSGSRVFEGAFHLHAEHLREAPAGTNRLVTVGAAISLVVTALVVRYAIDTSRGLAFLIGALRVATGPTVITPITYVVAVRERVAPTLKTEGVGNDVTAAILEIVTFVANPCDVEACCRYIEGIGGHLLEGCREFVRNVPDTRCRHFSSDVHDVPELDGSIELARRFDSPFDRRHTRVDPVGRDKNLLIHTTNIGSDSKKRDP